MYISGGIFVGLETESKSDGIFIRVYSIHHKFMLRLFFEQTSCLDSKHDVCSKKNLSMNLRL